VKHKSEIENLLTFSSAILPKTAASSKKSIPWTQSCPGSSGLQRLAQANALRNPYGRSRLVAAQTGVGNCFRPGGLRRGLFDAEPTRCRFKMDCRRKAKKIKRENGKSEKGGRVFTSRINSQKACCLSNDRR